MWWPRTLCSSSTFRLPEEDHNNTTVSRPLHCDPWRDCGKCNCLHQFLGVPYWFLGSSTKCKAHWVSSHPGKTLVGYCRCLHQLSSWEHDNQEWAYVQVASPLSSCPTSVGTWFALLVGGGGWGWSLFCTTLYIRNRHRGELQDEDDIIENLIQNPPPSIFRLEDLVKETKENT